MRTFELNGITYTAKPFSFNMICDLEDIGVSLEDAVKKPTALFRIYIALCTGKTLEEAGNLVEEHVINGGDITDAMKVMTEELNNSDFFQSLNKGTKKKATKSTAK